jgi:hypothetical protein
VLQGVGASSSGLLAGEIVDHLGYSPAFPASAAIALAGSWCLRWRCQAVAKQSPQSCRACPQRFRRRALMVAAQAAPGSVRVGSGPGPERGEE